MYQFINPQQDHNAEKLWKQIQKSLAEKTFIMSITDVIYELIEVSEKGITYSAKSRSANAPETITKENAISILQGLIEQTTFNTDTTKSLFRSTTIYRQRSPMFAILIASGIIEMTTK